MRVITVQLLSSFCSLQSTCVGSYAKVLIYSQSSYVWSFTLIFMRYLNKYLVFIYECSFVILLNILKPLVGGRLSLLFVLNHEPCYCTIECFCTLSPCCITKYLNWYLLAGKSTILRLLFRFFDTHSGSVRTDAAIFCNCLLLTHYGLINWYLPRGVQS